MATKEHHHASRTSQGGILQIANHLCREYRVKNSRVQIACDYVLTEWIPSQGKPKLSWSFHGIAIRTKDFSSTCQKGIHKQEQADCSDRANVERYCVDPDNPPREKVYLFVLTNRNNSIHNSNNNTSNNCDCNNFQQLQHDDWKRDLQSESPTMVDHDTVPYLTNRLSVGDCNSPSQPLFDRGHLLRSHPLLTQTHTYTHASISTPTDRPQAVRWTFVRPFHLCHLLPPCRNIRTHRT